MSSTPSLFSIGSPYSLMLSLSRSLSLSLCLTLSLSLSLSVLDGMDLEARLQAQKHQNERQMKLSSLIQYRASAEHIPSCGSSATHAQVKCMSSDMK